MAVLYQPLMREALQGFLSQLEAPGFLESMEAFARKKAWRVSRVRGYDDPDYARNLVQDVIGDVFCGRISWSFEESALEDAVVAAIHWRAERDVKRARRFSAHVEVDAVSGDDDLDVTARMDLAVAFTEVMRLTRDHAGSDREVCSLIAAREQGATTRAEITAMSGLSTLEYDAARKRFARILLKLPQHLRNVLRDL